MRIRTIRHIFKEGFVNSYRNKLMSLASVAIVVASLIVFGVFLLVAFNMEENIGIWKEQPQLEAFCYVELDDTQVQRVEDAIKNDNRVLQYERVSKELAFEKMRDKLGKNSAILDGYGSEIFPVSFILKLKDMGYSDGVVKSLGDINGIEKVSYSQDTIEVITRVSYWFRLGSSVMIAIFLIVSVFIISNTIKLTVFARRKEINIMKYVGATDWFIRWPFVVEGVIISIIGAVFAFVITAYGYSAIHENFAQDLFLAESRMLVMVDIKDIWTQLILWYLAIGTVIGTIGSFVSLRRHLRV